jgi:plasmid stabilization system protein ParE
MAASSAYILSEAGRSDLLRIWLYIFQESGSPDQADRVLLKLREAMALLSEQPDAGHLREDLTAKPVKFWSVFDYLVVYDPHSRPVQILRVLHGARDVENLL